MPLPAVEIRPNNDLDLGIEIDRRATGEAASGRTVTATLSEDREHSTNDPVTALAGTSPVTLTETGSTGVYEGAIDRIVIDDAVIDATPGFSPAFGSRKLYLHWDDGEGFHDWAPCIVRSS